MLVKGYLQLLGLSVLLCYASARLGRIRIDPDNHWFIDEYDRVVILRGVNAVQKGFPWYPQYLVNEPTASRRYNDLRDWGFNIMRLGSMWTGAEPIEGEFNGTYIDILDDIVKRLENTGLYTMLDMHQDCLSSYYPPSYDGVPKWLIDSFPEPSEEYPWPLEEITQWEQGYLTQGVSESMQHIYNNTEGALDKWTNFWVVLAQRFHTEPAVIGYNYINEPWIGDYLSNDRLLLPGVSGSQNLLPSYDYITEAIREFDNEGIVFYEPVFYGQLFSADILGSGFDRVPGGESQRHLGAYSWHSYCWNLEFIAWNATDEEREEAREFCYTQLIPKMFQSATENVNKTGGAAILTEFGICNGYSDWDYHPISLECDIFMDLSDEYLHSFTEWEYTGSWYDGNGNPKWGRIKPHVRPFPHATAGIPTRMFFNRTTIDYIYEFDLDLTINQPTVVFIPQLWYEDGFVVDVSETLEYDIDGNYINLEPTDVLRNSKSGVNMIPSWVRVTTP